MPQQIVKNLISDLHERFGDDLVSPQQQALMNQLQAHVHDMSEEEPITPSFIDTVETLLTEVEIDHPHVASILSQVVDTLKNIGV